MKKIIFYGLGPTRSYMINDIEYRDGHVAEVDDKLYNLLISRGFAMPYNEQVERKIINILEYDRKKRSTLKQKFKNLLKED